MILLVIFLLTLISFNCFALAKANHYRDAFTVRPNQRISFLLTLAAWIIILLTVVLSYYQYQGYGVLLWCGFMAMSIVIITALISYKAIFIKWLFLFLLIITFIIGLFFLSY
ncbi:DUF3325 domain-containing protein [Pseudoalteromonas tunicata]|uniref:DUF3325 domain-containing protein n=1 Tax=Pseudoalteromonas tunicata TaxID=314281 RepID=UPI00273DCEDE|nr:DUF3325 domain-containing protein [Pseudoalteromonas tunicata]MDP5214466.1 DUF3325 domain-containing protein [Pseudoalteromonas tunicata]